MCIRDRCSAIDEKYDMERLWNTGGKNWTYEYKYRRGGKTLCSLYAKSNCVGFMIIFGKDKRAKFEDIRDMLSDSVCKRYDEAPVSYTHLANTTACCSSLNLDHRSRSFLCESVRETGESSSANS